MLPLFHIEELARRDYSSTLKDVERTQTYNRAIRQGKAREALERVIEENIHSGASYMELKRELLALLQRASH